MEKKQFQISLAAARVNAGLTQQDVASMMKVSKNTIVNWENGKVEMKPAQFKMYYSVVGAPENIVNLPKI